MTSPYATRLRADDHDTSIVWPERSGVYRTYTARTGATSHLAPLDADDVAVLALACCWAVLSVLVFGVLVVVAQ